ncbi:MAG: adenine deaminase [Spirochaetes bacterium]|nr:adenine deaminase [Spirochaetota bacterium]
MFPYNKDSRKLLDTALGNLPADLVIVNGTLMDVYSGRIIPGRSVAVAGEWIAYTGEDAAHTIGENTRIIDANGRLIAPGYIDSHTHIANYSDLSDILKYLIPGGTTTVVTEVETYGISMGAEGISLFLEQIKDRPVKIFCLIPPLVAISPALNSRFITNAEAERLLENEMVLGLGESYWQNAILPGDDRIIELIQTTLKAGKTVQGHSAGASDRKLAAYASTGVQSCHESVSSEDVLAKIEMGLYNIVREGHIRRDLGSIRSLIGKIDLRRCTLCTDGVDPEGLLANGYLVDVVQEAVDMGISPMDALRMVTLNPAENLRIDHLVGGIAPGHFADILLLPEPGKMYPDIVISMGKVIAEEGKNAASLKRIPFPEKMLNTVNVQKVKPQDFTVYHKASSGDSVRLIEIQENGLVAREGTAKISSVRKVLFPPESDVLKLTFIESVTGNGEKFTGFVKNWGQKKGAIATSLCWDSAGIIAIGANDADLAAAINRVIDMQGGIAVSVNEKIKYDIPFRIGAYVSGLPVEELNTRIFDLKNLLFVLGVKYEYPILTLTTLTTPAIPFIRITEKGYFRFRENDYAGI